MDPSKPEMLAYKSTSKQGSGLYQVSISKNETSIEIYMNIISSGFTKTVSATIQEKEWGSAKMKSSSLAEITFNPTNFVSNGNPEGGSVSMLVILISAGGMIVAH